MTDTPEGDGDEVDVVIALDDAALNHLDDVVEDLASRGLAVTDVQSTLGTVSGHVAQSSLSSLSAVPGVEAIEEGRTFQLPPPDADVQGGPSE